jgi:hypothetical protein
MGSAATRVAAILLLAISVLIPLPVAASPKRPIDVDRSVLKVHVFRSGLFSVFGHNHEIAAPIEQGSVTLEPSAVEFRVSSCKLRVLDPDVSAQERAEVQKTMEGPEVLDCARFPQIRFESSSVQPAGAEQWIVRGHLWLHGQTRPVTVAVRKEGGRYVGSAKLKQRDFGMTPVSVAGGTVKVKDEVKIEFEIYLSE